MSAKFAKKKSAYVSVKHFTNLELYSIITKHKSAKNEESWMSLDVKGETKNEKMEEHKVRYLPILVTDLEGKARPLYRDLAATITQSKCKLSKSEDGKIPSSASFSTRIQIMCEVGDVLTLEQARAALKPVDETEWTERVSEFKLTNGYKVTQPFIDAVIQVATEILVDEKFPDLSDDQRGITVKRQMELLTQQYIGWCVDKAIAGEFERLLNDKKIRTEIGWTKKAEQKIAANVQRTRDAREGDADDAKLLRQLSEVAGHDVEAIPLDEWMVYYRVRIDSRTGDLWCKIYDQTVKSKVPGQRKIATMKNPTTSLIEPLNYQTVEEWLRYGSAFTGYVKYQLCISKVGGARLHAAMAEMAVRRGAKGTASSHIDNATVDYLDDFGGNFGGDDEEAESAAPPPKAPINTALERQMQNYDMDDE